VHLAIPRLHGLQSFSEVDAADAVVRFAGHVMQALEPDVSLYAPTGHGKQAPFGSPAIAAVPKYPGRQLQSDKCCDAAPEVMANKAQPVHAVLPSSLA